MVYLRLFLIGCTLAGNQVSQKKDLCVDFHDFKISYQFC